MRSLLIALRCLTIVPIPSGKGDDDRAVAQSRLWYPLVGVAIGLILAGISLLARRVFGDSLLAAATTVLFWTLLTGALHLDGLADCCDGLFARGDRERRLEIMRDPHVGTFGVVAVVLCLLLKTAAVASMAMQQLRPAVAGSVLAGRCVILVVAGLSPYARASGTGKSVIDAAGWPDCIWGCLWLAPLAAVTHWSFVLAAFGLVTIGGATWSWICRKRIGGATGDCLGGACEIVETLALVVFGFAPSSGLWPELL